MWVSLAWLREVLMDAVSSLLNVKELNPGGTPVPHPPWGPFRCRPSEAPPFCLDVSVLGAASNYITRRSLFENLRALLFPEAKHLQDQMYSFCTNEMTHF